MRSCTATVPRSRGQPCRPGVRGCTRRGRGCGVFGGSWYMSAEEQRCLSLRRLHPCRLWVRAPVPACGCRGVDCGVESDVLISRGDVSRLTAQALKPKCPMQLGNYVLASTEFESCRVVGNIPASFFRLYATGNFHGDLPSRTTARAHSAHRAPMNDLFRFLSPPQL